MQEVGANLFVGGLDPEVDEKVGAAATVPAAVPAHCTATACPRALPQELSCCTVAAAAVPATVPVHCTATAALLPARCVHCLTAVLLCMHSGD